MREARSRKHDFIPRWMAIGLAAAALTGSALLAPSPAAATEMADYPWCLSREGYLDCLYWTLPQCQATASGIGGCAPNPRVLFPPQPQERPIRSKY